MKGGVSGKGLKGKDIWGECGWEGKWSKGLGGMDVGAGAWVQPRSPAKAW